MTDLYDTEIERCIQMSYPKLEACWGTSGTCRGDAEPPDANGSPLFFYCGTNFRCGCPTFIVRADDEYSVAETPALTRRIRRLSGIPSDFSQLETAWEKADADERRKILRPFAIAQRATDKVLAELASVRLAPCQAEDFAGVVGEAQ